MFYTRRRGWLQILAQYMGFVCAQFVPPASAGGLIPFAFPMQQSQLMARSLIYVAAALLSCSGALA